MHVGEIDWSAIGTFVTKGVETAGQIQSQRLAQKSQIALAQMELEQARLDQQTQRSLQFATQQNPALYSQSKPLRYGSPSAGINPIYLMGGAGAILLLIFLMVRK